VLFYLSEIINLEGVFKSKLFYLLGVYVTIYEIGVNLLSIFGEASTFNLCGVWYFLILSGLFLTLSL